jgi:PhzF family phenazine biosynthesis protein
LNTEVLFYTAFTTDPSGGNPAGVVLDARGLGSQEMQRIAAEVGYSETAFLTRRPDGEFDVRYFSPQTEVTFCGHATVAAAVARADLDGPSTLGLHTLAGRVGVSVDANMVATLVSVTPKVASMASADLAEILAALGWSTGDLEVGLEPGLAYAGAWHAVLRVATRERLASVDYDFERLGRFMRVRQWITVDLVWRETPGIVHSRNLFPSGGVVEDPASGAAAAALGAFLDLRGLLPASRTFVVRQGEDMGRPSRLHVTVPIEVEAGVSVSGRAVAIT